jgi:alpha 1,3-glucosidase
MKDVRVEKIIVVDAPAGWAGLSAVSIEEEGGMPSKAAVDFHPATGKKAAWAVIRNPKVAIGSSWKITFA